MRKYIERMRANFAALDFKDSSTWLATWGGLGLLQPGPGTWGTLGAIPFAIAFELFGGAPMLWLAAFIITTIGLRTTHAIEKRLGQHDASLIVIDEVAGMWLALAVISTLLPLAAIHYALAFVLFRILDIWKPFPIGWLDQNVPGPLGVMADDLAAGAAAGILVLVIDHVLLAA